jgi:hypothetical protein
MLQKLVKMSVREAINILAGPRDWGDTRDSWLARAAKRVEGVSFRTVRSLWYGTINNENHWAARAIQREAELTKARQEAKKLAATYESIARGLDVTNTNSNSADVAALLHAARVLRGLDRS